MFGVKQEAGTMPENQTSFRTLAQSLEICSFSGLAQDFPPHFHNHYLIGCMLGGKRRLLFCGREAALQPGDLVCLNPGDIHGCAQAGDLPLSWLGLHFSVDCMRNLAKRLTGYPGMPFFRNKVWFNSPMATVFSSMSAAMHETGFSPDDFIEKDLPRILEWSGEFDGKRATDAAPAAFKKLLAHLMANPPAHFSLDEMSAVACLDKYSLVRNFKAVYGITPWRYLEALRVNLGLQMLDEGQKIADAAINCGFTDQSHFSRCFKARTGITPGKYQKAHGAARP